MSFRVIARLGDIDWDIGKSGSPLGSVILQSSRLCVGRIAYVYYLCVSSISLG